MTSRRSSQNNPSRWLPVGGAAALLAAVIGIGVVSGRSDSDGDAAGSTTTVSDGATTVPTTLPPPVTYDAVDEGPETVAKVPLSQPLRNGNVGSEVEMVQNRLAELGFDPGPVDGVFGGLTTQAVWAFEKLVMKTPRTEATGVVDTELWDRMQDPIRIAPRRPSNSDAGHTEIYLPEQVMAIFDADQAVVIAHISTGELAPGATGFTPWQETAAEYCDVVTIDTDANGVLLEEPVEKAICGRSYTPPGVFTAYKKIEGRRQSALGGMYDPIYINQGIAIHGANEIPLHPASHGCIRVSRPLGEKLQSVIDIGDQVMIWDGVTEPWNQPASASQMRFDYPDPTATTTTTTVPPTTSTTTSTVPDTTSVPASTEAPTASTEPPSATTSTVAVASTTTIPTTTIPPTTTVAEIDIVGEG